MAWLRFEEDSFDDEAIVRQRWWVQLSWPRLLCTVKRYGVDGSLPPAMSTPSFLADLWGCPDLDKRRIQAALDTLAGALGTNLSCGKPDAGTNLSCGKPVPALIFCSPEGGISIKNWSKYQPDARVSDRVRKHRERSSASKILHLPGVETVTKRAEKRKVKRPSNDGTYDGGRVTYDGEGAGAASTPAPETVTAPPKPTGLDRLIAAWERGYRWLYAKAPSPPDGRDRAELAKLIRNGRPQDCPPDRWVPTLELAVETFYFKDTREFLQDKSHAIHWFVQDVNKYLRSVDYEPNEPSGPPSAAGGSDGST